MATASESLAAAFAAAEACAKVFVVPQKAIPTRAITSEQEGATQDDDLRIGSSPFVQPRLNEDDRSRTY
jgi:hypothetical protein